MDGPSDFDDTTFQRLLNREILLSERRRMLILAALQAFILVLILLAATFGPGFVRSIYHDRVPERAALVVFSAFVAYELFVAGLSRSLSAEVEIFRSSGATSTRSSRPAFRPCCSIFSPDICPRPRIFGTWPALLYFLFIILSTLRLDFVLSAFTGAVAAIELFVLAFVTCICLAGRGPDLTSPII